MSTKFWTTTVISILLAVISLSLISMTSLDGDTLDSADSADPNSLSYTMKNYTDGTETTYKLEVKGYAASTDGNNFTYSEDPVGFVKGTDYRVGVIYGPAEGSAAENATWYMIQYSLFTGTDGTPYFSVVKNTIKSVAMNDGVMTVGGSVDPSNYAVAIIPSTFTFTIPANSDLSGVQSTQKPIDFVGKKTEYKIGTVNKIAGKQAYLKTVIILGNPTIPSTDVLIDMATVETLVFSGSPTMMDTLALAGTKATNLREIYFDGDCSLLADHPINSLPDAPVDVYLTSNETTKITDRLSLQKNTVHLYFSDKSTVPSAYGDSTAGALTTVAFHIHKSSPYWAAYKQNGKIVSMDISTNDVAPTIYSYPADPNSLSYTMKNYTDGTETTYKLEVKGYAASTDGNNFTYSEDPVGFVKGTDYRVGVIYGPAEGSAAENATWYMIQYSLFTGTDGTPYFSVVKNTIKSVAMNDGVMTVGGSVDPSNYAVAIIPSTFTFTIPANSDLSGVQSTQKPIDFVGKKTEYKIGTVNKIAGKQAYLKTVIILGNPTIPSTDVLIDMATVETLVFSGSPTMMDTLALAGTKATNLREIYFDGDCSLLADHPINSLPDAPVDVYLTSNETTKITDRLSLQKNTVHLYFSDKSTVPSAYGDSTAGALTTVAFHIHKSSPYWAAYKQNGKIVSMDISTNDVAPTIYSYPLKKLTVTDPSGGTLKVESEYAPEGYAIEGNKVVLIPASDAGYILKSIKCVSNGEEISISNEEGSYYFVMPGSDVSISAEFNKAIPEINSSYNVNGSQVDISVTFNGVPASDETPDKVIVYVKYKVTDNAYSFAKMTVNVPVYADGYSIATCTSMTALPPVEYLIQVFSGNILLNSEVVKIVSE